MTVAIDAGTQAALDAGRWIERDALSIDIGGTVYGFWTGIAPMTWNSITFNPGASLIEIEPITLGDDLAARDLTARLRALPEAGLTPDVLGSIEAYAYRAAPVVIYRFFFDPDSRAHLSTEPLWRGTVQRIEHEQDGEAYALKAILSPRSFGLQRSGVRVRTVADQARFSATDKALRHAARIRNATIYWGSSPPKRQGGASAAKGGRAGGLRGD